MQKDRQNKLAIWIIVIGGMVSLVTPLLVPLLPIHHLKDYGTIGDVIGGISNPFTQLIGFVLLFLALKAQVKANNLIKNQMDTENHKEMQQRELTHLHHLYTFMENNISNFNYENKFVENGSIQLLHGRRAIRCFINDIEKMNIDLHNTEQLLQEDGVREILSLLKTAKLIFDKIDSADIQLDDKIFYKNIMKHELVFSIFPYTDLDESADLILPVCEECGEFHGNYPPIIFDKLSELKRYFK